MGQAGRGELVPFLSQLLDRNFLEFEELGECFTASLLYMHCFILLSLLSVRQQRRQCFLVVGQRAVRVGSSLFTEGVPEGWICSVVSSGLHLASDTGQE